MGATAWACILKPRRWHQLWPHPRQVFLITDKDATPGVFAALSVNLRKYRFVFADVHSSDAEALQRLGVKKVKGYPNLLLEPMTEAPVSLSV